MKTKDPVTTLFLYQWVWFDKNEQNAVLVEIVAESKEHARKLAIVAKGLNSSDWTLGELIVLNNEPDTIWGLNTYHHDAPSTRITYH